MALRLRSIQYPAADSTMPAPSIRSASQPLVPVWISLASCTAGSTGSQEREPTPAGAAPSAIADPGRRGHGRPGTSAGCTAGGCRRLPAGRGQPSSGSTRHSHASSTRCHRTASLNLFSLPLFHPASSVFCAVPRWFFSIISHPRCNLPESRGNVPLCRLRLALKTV